jgi:hypothetical protein
MVIVQLPSAATTERDEVQANACKITHLELELKPHTLEILSSSDATRVGHRPAEARSARRGHPRRGPRARLVSER